MSEGSEAERYFIMSDTTDTDETEAPAEQMPAMETFKVTVVRQFEIDYSKKQLDKLLSQVDSYTEQEAIEEMFMEQEKEYIEPEQKLLGIDTGVEKE